MTKSDQSTWCRLPLGDANMADEDVARIRGDFEAEWNRAGRPKQWALYRRLESTGGLHCEAVIYFSPSAVNIARRHRAQPCEPPNPSGLELLAGNSTQAPHSDLKPFNRSG